MIYLPGGSAPFPHPDLLNNIKEDYEEARAILSWSPRSAAALLRLTIEKLVNAIVKKNWRTKGEAKCQDWNLVRNGLRSDIQRGTRFC